MVVAPFIALVVVDQFNVKRIRAIKTEDNPSVRPHRNRPKPLHISFQRVKPVSRKAKLLRRYGVVEHGQDFLNCIDQIRPYPATVVALVEALQATVLKAPNH
jgi:hypothetical protein